MLALCYLGEQRCCFWLCWSAEYQRCTQGHFRKARAFWKCCLYLFTHSSADFNSHPLFDYSETLIRQTDSRKKLLLVRHDNIIAALASWIRTIAHSCWISNVDTSSVHFLVISLIWDEKYRKFWSDNDSLVKLDLLFCVSLGSEAAQLLQGT